MHSHSTPVILPALVSPIFRRMSVSGRPRWVMNVSSRLIAMRTVPPILRASSRGDQLDVERFRAAAEAAADERLHHADARHVHAEDLRQHQVHVVGHLRGGMHGEPVAHRVVVGDGGVHLHLVLAHLGAVVGGLAHQVGGGERFSDVAQLERHIALEIAGLLLVQLHGSRAPSRRPP